MSKATTGEDIYRWGEGGGRGRERERERKRERGKKGEWCALHVKGQFGACDCQ
jgi:hypothetical protein